MICGFIGLVQIGVILLLLVGFVALPFLLIWWYFRFKNRNNS